MKSFKSIAGLVLFLFFTTTSLTAGAEEAAAEEAAETGDGNYVLLETSLGNIVMELYPEKAPKSVKNFKEYVKSGFYDKTMFHRVIKGFMVQGGGYDLEFQQKETMAPIMNEADNGLKNDKWTVAMARTSIPHSATSQFFINVVDNGPLNYTGRTSRGWGYAVFGKVISGFKTVTEIENVNTVAMMGHNNMPAMPVVILTAKLLDSPPE